MLTGQLLLQMIVILLVVQLFGSISRSIGLVWVIGEIVAGLALGPSLLGFLWPQLESFLFAATSLPTLQTFGDIGLVLYMFSLGARIDTHVMVRQSRKAVFISLSGILLPLVSGALLGFFLYPDLAGTHATFLSFILLVGTAMAITAFPVLARLLVEKEMIKTEIGILALASSSIDDVIAWCLLAFVIAIAHSQTTFSTVGTIGLIILFAAVMLFAVRPLLGYVMSRIEAKSLQMALSIILLFGAAYITNALGIHPIFGAFLAGICLPRTSVFAAYMENIDEVNTMIFLPIFFVYSGLQTRIGLIQGLSLWLICLLVLLIACAGKILGGTLSTRLMRYSWRDAWGVGFLLNTRGLVELIVLNVGLQAGILSPTLFAMLVLMALVTTMMASPLLSLFGYPRPVIDAPASDDVGEAIEPTLS